MQQNLLEAATQTEPPPKADVEQPVPAAVAAELVVRPATATAQPAPAAPAAPAEDCKRLGTPRAATPKPQTPARPATAGVCGGNNRLPTPATPAASQQSRPATARAATPAADSKKLLPARPKTSLKVQSTTKQQPQQLLSDRTPMALSHNPDPRLRSWQRLEHLRLHGMGLSSKLSRRYNVARVLGFEPVGSRFPAPSQQPQGDWLPTLMSHRQQQQQPQPIFYAAIARKKNDVAPFRTSQKATCGVFFTRDTDNKKAKHDLEPTDLIKWRYFL